MKAKENQKKEETDSRFCLKLKKKPRGDSIYHNRCEDFPLRPLFSPDTVFFCNKTFGKKRDCVESSLDGSLENVEKYFHGKNLVRTRVLFLCLIQ